MVNPPVKSSPSHSMEALARSAVDEAMARGADAAGVESMAEEARVTPV